MSAGKLLCFFLITACAEALAQTSLWSGSATPGVPSDPDGGSVTLGVKFYSDVPGTVTGVRFYKGSGNTGTHVGKLYSSSGGELASATFTAESGSGWQQVSFPSPVTISANTTYTVAYFAPVGHYAADESYPWSSINSAPLHVSGPSPGVYNYGSGPVFPTQSWSSSNYYVDVLFTPGTSTQSPAPSQPSAPTQPSAPSQTSQTFWPSSAAPSTASASDTGSVTLGLKFYSDVAGTLSGVRFFKGANNTGTHVGKVYSSSGTELASVTFSGESSSGWQQANFSSPVSIQPNTTYVVSYFAPKGGYAANANYGWTSVSATPLHVSGTAPGVYAYGSTPAFPNSTYSNTNYWVDLVFVPSSGSAATYTLSGVVKGSAATLTLSGAVSATAKTDSAGNFSFSGLPNGSYVIAPSQSGYSFSPSTAQATINGASITNLSFTATAASAPVSHKVTLSWNASVSPNIVGYNVYRATSSGGPYTKLTGVSGTSFTDTAVNAGYTYFYVATSVDSSSSESTYSNETKAIVPTP